MGLSVNDSYWIVPEGFEGKFKDCNLFENGFDKALSLIAWTGFGSVRPSGFSSSPEFTTNGNLRKGWRRIGGKIMLYKLICTAGLGPSQYQYRSSDALISERYSLV